MSGMIESELEAYKRIQVIKEQSTVSKGGHSRHHSYSMRILQDEAFWLLGFSYGWLKFCTIHANPHTIPKSDNV